MVNTNRPAGLSKLIDMFIAYTHNVKNSKLLTLVHNVQYYYPNFILIKDNTSILCRNYPRQQVAMRMYYFMENFQTNLNIEASLIFLKSTRFIPK